MKAVARACSVALCLLLGVSLLPAPAQNGGAPAQNVSRADLVPGLDVKATEIYQEQFRLMINMIPMPGRGFVVASLEPGSPAGDMVRVDNAAIHARLEPGDIITHVNGQPVPTLATYYRLLQQSGGQVTLTVIDRNSGQAINWQSRAIRGLVPIMPPEPVPPVPVPPEPIPPQPVPGGRTVHVLLIGLTNDGSIGKGIQVNLDNMERVLRNEITRESLDLEVVSAAGCNAQNIIGKLRQLGQRSKQGDSIFCYYSGHGAFDPRYAAGNPSQGHFFQIPGGDLLRKTLFDNMLAQPGRLKVLVTDCCNVQSVASLGGRVAPQAAEVVVAGPTAIEKLLLYHRGYLDVNAASQNQFSWYNDRFGGLFSYTFIKLMPEYGEWQPFLDRVAVDANALYLQRRQAVLADPSNNQPDVVNSMRNQTAMTPAVFLNHLTRDANIPSGPQRTVTRITPTLVYP